MKIPILQLLEPKKNNKNDTCQSNEKTTNAT